MSLLLSFLYIVGIYGAYLAGSFYLRTQSDGQAPRKIPYATIALMVAIAIPTTLQFFFPEILQLFERNYERFLAGDWWRIVTSLFVQDGGMSGSIFNLVSLLLIGTVAETFWGSRKWLIIFFTGGILSQLAGFVWQPIGAGNSVANFSLAASVATLCLFLRSSRPVKISAACAVGAGVILLLLRDIHGFAVLLGVSIALFLIRLDRPKQQGPS
jgi:membrane associated rhomboid family serine protease